MISRLGARWRFVNSLDFIPRSGRTVSVLKERACFGWCMMRAMASPGRESEPVDLQLLIDSIPALTPSGLPNGELNEFSRTWLTPAGLTLEDLWGWKWTLKRRC